MSGNLLYCSHYNAFAEIRICVIPLLFRLGHLSTTRILATRPWYTFLFTSFSIYAVFSLRAPQYWTCPQVEWLRMTWIPVGRPTFCHILFNWLVLGRLFTGLNPSPGIPAYAYVWKPSLLLNYNVFTVITLWPFVVCCCESLAYDTVPRDSCMTHFSFHIVFNRGCVLPLLSTELNPALKWNDSVWNGFSWGIPLFFSHIFSIDLSSVPSPHRRSHFPGMPAYGVD